MQRSATRGGNVSRKHLRLAADILYLDFLVADLRLHLQRKAAFDPNQPRDDHGRWTATGADASGGASEGDPQGSSPSPPSDDQTGQTGDKPACWPGADDNPQGYSPDKYGWHDYKAGPNRVCTAEQRCSRAEMADYLSRFAVPGQDPNLAAKDHGTYLVRMPGTEISVGNVRTEVSCDGLSIRNTTKGDHILYDGEVVRRATQDPDGSWWVTTHGIGNNQEFGMNHLNRLGGPYIFDTVDEQMREFIRKYHVSGKSLVARKRGPARRARSLGVVAALTAGADHGS